MKILIVAKHSKLEWDCKTQNKSLDAIAAEYITSGANYDAIIESHRHQQQVRQWLWHHVRGKMIMLNELTSDLLQNEQLDLVISLGGDNSFTKVAQSLITTTILGITIDPARSQGAMNNAKINTEQDAALIAQKLNNNTFKVDQWPRINTWVNDTLLPLSTSEVFLGERLRKNMSRYVIDGNEWKSSGLIVNTGAGSTGWALAAGIPTAYGKTYPKLGYIHTESFRMPGDYKGYINRDQVLTVQSLNDDGIVSADCWEEVPFNRGAVAKISMGTPLNVVRFI